MADYTVVLNEVKNLLPTAKSILIALPTGSDIDKLASGLSLYLTLRQQGKEVFIFCEDTLRVGQAHLYGIDHIQNQIPKSGGGNLVLTLEGVASSDGTVPSLQKLDWYAENNNLNLVFNVMPGQMFQPTRIVPHYQGSTFSLIFTLGATSLSSLGSISNQQIFTGTHIVNIDNQATNTSFGQTNIVDPNASSISEMATFIIQNLGLPLDTDSASNLLAGIFDSTANLTSPKVNPDTYLSIANLLKAGGKKPTISPQPTTTGGFDLSALLPQNMPAQNTAAKTSSVETFTTPTVVTVEQPSPEERPAGEGVISETPEPDWLTPKVYKGSSIG